MTRPYSFIRDINGYNGCALIPSDQIWSANLAAATATPLLVPSDAAQYVAYINIEPAKEVWVATVGTAAFKTVSNNALAGVASTSGAFVVNNIVVAADTSGSIKDGGAAISGFVLSTRTLTAAGLVTGGGDLSANRTFTVTAAVKTDQQTATSNTVAVTPGVQIFHPSAIKAYGTLNQTATPTWADQFNFTTIVRNSAGSYTVTMAVTFANANYQVVACPQDGSEVVWAIDQKTTTSFRIRQWTLVGILLADVQMGIHVTGLLA